MEVIKKKISLERFRSRTKSIIPFAGMKDDEFYPGLNWGKVAYDIDFSKLGEDAVNEYGNGIKKLGKMSYRDMMSKYAAITSGKIDLESIDDEEVEKLKSIVAFVNDKKVIDQPAPNFDPCCVPCVEESPVEWPEMDSGDQYVAPSVKMDICLVQSANLIGSYTFAAKNWVPGKRYFEGDKVIYDGKTFKLRDFTYGRVFYGTDSLMKARYLSGTELSSFAAFDEAYEGISEDIFDDTIVNSTAEMVDMGYIYAKMRTGTDGNGNPTHTYYIRPSWGGYFNVYDGDTYFDELVDQTNPEDGFVMRGEYDTQHWKISDDITSHGVYKVTGRNKGVSISAEQNRSVGYDDVTLTGLHNESKLVNLKRYTKTVTDDCEELPGKLNSLRSSRVLDLQYVIGTIKNIDTTGESAIGDYLAHIEFIPDDCDGFVIKPVAGTSDNYDVHADKLLQEYGGRGEYVRFQNLDSYASVVSTWAANGSGDDGCKGVVRFTYYIGAELELEKNSNGVVEKDARYIYNGGKKRLIYQDSYRYIARYRNDRISGRPVTAGGFVYIDINYDDKKSEVAFENIYNYRDYVILADVTAHTQSMTDGGESVSPNFQNSNYFMEDYKIGVEFVANNNTNVYIDRGNAAAFERHMRLSEVDTLQDLENYGNGMFKLKQ